MEKSAIGKIKIPEVTSMADLTRFQLDLVQELQNRAVTAWWTPGHPGWYSMGTKQTPARYPLELDDGSASHLCSTFLAEPPLQLIPGSPHL